MDTNTTCGAGVAEQSIVPARLADLTEAMATVLAVHQKSLDLSDANSRKELDGYAKVVEALRKSARELKAAASQMEASRTLPMGRHDREALSSPEAIDAFADFVRVEQELRDNLRSWVERHQQMLGAMRG
ncbi:MAG TPA: hypothetical protein VF310_12605 [Vicinamibacteria bacterium]